MKFEAILTTTLLALLCDATRLKGGGYGGGYGRGYGGYGAARQNQGAAQRYNSYTHIKSGAAQRSASAARAGGGGGYARGYGGGGVAYLDDEKNATQEIPDDQEDDSADLDTRAGDDASAALETTTDSQALVKRGLKVRDFKHH